MNPNIDVPRRARCAIDQADTCQLRNRKSNHVYHCLRVMAFEAVYTVSVAAYDELFEHFCCDQATNC
jgi:hypothetical protein